MTAIVVPDGTGGFTLDAALLAERFGWSPDELRALMQGGFVTSRVERGVGDDSGRWRLSVRCGWRRWQAIIEPDGTIADQQMHHVRQRRSAWGAATAVPAQPGSE